MVLFSLLIALLLQRSVTRTTQWQLGPFTDTWLQQIDKLQDKYAWARHEWLLPLLWVAPALVLGLLLVLQDSALLTLIINILVLLVVIGCPGPRAVVRDYLRHASHQRKAPCEALHGELAAIQPELAYATVGQHIIWLNFRYYFAVAFWFILFGAAGALAYALIREAAVRSVQGSEQSVAYNRILHWLDILPSRVAGFAYLLVGHFSRAFPTWLGGVFRVHESNSHYLTVVAVKAEDSSIDAHDLSDEPALMLTLAKRTMVLLLAATALATLLGWLA